MRLPARHPIVRPVRNFLLTTIILGALVLFAFTLWWWHGSNRLARANARLESLHIRYHPDNFSDGASLRGPENGYNAFLEITSKVKVTAEQRSSIDETYSGRPGADKRPAFTAISAHADVIAQLDALENKSVVWPFPIFDKTYWDLVDAKKALRRMVHIAASFGVEQKQSRVALPNIRRMLILARIEACDRSLGPIMAMIYMEQACELLRNALPACDFTDPDQRNQAEHILVMLRSDQFLRVGMLDAWEFGLVDSLSNEESLPWIFQPLADEDTAGYIEHEIACIESLRSRTRSELLAHPTPRSRIHPSRGDELLVMPLQSRRERTIAGLPSAVLTAEVTCRATAALLAAHLYKAQHKSFPADLSNLLPTFFDAIPTDPFADNQPLHYRLDPAGPVIWSVGPDGIDQHADSHSDDLVFSSIASPINSRPH